MKPSRLEELDYRYLIRNELLQRIKANPSYSSRAMARDLGLSSAFFSQVMTGKKNLSEAKGIAVADRLRFNPQTSRLFLNLIRYVGSKDPRHKERILADLSSASPERAEYFDLKIDMFRIVSDWYHFAIVELTAVQSFKNDARWIAERLGITKLEAEAAIDRLLRVGLLKETKGRLEKTKAFYKAGDVPSEAVRSFHRQALARAVDALENRPFEERDFSCATMAVSASKLPKAKEMIRNFQKEMLSFFEQGTKQAVYHLSIQFHRADREEK
ncbi:MAG TPA: DUF4423 domain-containing protein [Bdellovibrionales bacterium]|nr:DUF4423 domain-containing protein [Bdellovibrionales bacterium]